MPYLSHPPQVIPIDLGRQLFVDDFLIAETSLIRAFGKPEIHPQSPVLSPETDEEMDSGYCPMAAPFNDGAWYDPQDNLFKLWYMPGWFHSHRPGHQHRWHSLATPATRHHPRNQPGVAEQRWI